MAQAKLDVRTHDGVMDVYLHAPEGSGPFPTVILYVDAGGVRPAMHEMAEHLAATGYLVAMPNLFHRAGAFEAFDLDTVWSDPPERARIMALVKQASPAAVMADTTALLDALAKEPRARAERVGCVGYCLGGRLAFTAAGAHPECVVAAACIHGGHIATDDPESPHRHAARIRAALYFGVADGDTSCPPESQATLKAALDAAKVRYVLDVFRGAAHGFAVKDLAVYDPVAADKQWQRVFALFAKTL
ncbi:Dienelactone hydrolase family protein [Minicystis rosea]|nr:Dienelactone hydrolase family protein [Minicystis rosea]